MFVQVSGITSFFFLFILLYFLFPLCYGSPLTHFVILLTSPHARITHVFLKKKVDRKNWYTETACSNGESQTQTRYIHAITIFFFAFFSPSFSPSFSIFFWCDKWYHLAHVPPNTTRVCARANAHTNVCTKYMHICICQLNLVFLPHC